MRISTKTRYAMRFMAELASHWERGRTSLKDIAERQGISKKYLEQCVAPLAAADLILVTRGPGGGYELSRPPEEITAADVVAATEGDLFLLDCLEGEYDCPLRKQCRTQQVWSGLEDAMASYLGGISLRDLPAMEQTHS